MGLLIYLPRDWLLEEFVKLLASNVWATHNNSSVGKVCGATGGYSVLTMVGEVRTRHINTLQNATALL